MDEKKQFEGWAVSPKHLGRYVDEVTFRLNAEVFDFSEVP